MPFLDEIQSAVQSVAVRVGPSVAGLGRGWGRGSGVVIAPGRILTNAHVLRGEEVAVTLGGGRAGEAVHGRVAGLDADLDIAVVEADTAGAEPVAWDSGAVDGVTVGLPVFALADPGGRGLRVTFGLVSAAARSFRGPRGRRIAGSVEHTAPLPRGSSGGPLVDGEGRLLGLNTVRLEGGLILALPADTGLRARVDGVARGDLLVAANGRRLDAVDDLFDALEAAEGTLLLTLVRGTEERELPVELGDPSLH